MAVGLLSLMFGLGASSAALAAPKDAMAGCSDPAVAAAIDGKETRTINENKIPGSGLALSALPAFAGIQIIGHQIEVLGGQATADPNTAICLVRMQVTAQTPQGVKTAAEDFAYRIGQMATDLTVTFCPDRQCPAEAAAVTLKTSQNERLIR